MKRRGSTNGHKAMLFGPKVVDEHSVERETCTAAEAVSYSSPGQEVAPKRTSSESERAQLHSSAQLGRCDVLRELRRRNGRQLDLLRARDVVLRGHLEREVKDARSSGRLLL